MVPPSHTILLQDGMCGGLTMFILSMKTTRPRVLVTVAVVLVLLVTMLVLSNRQNVTATGGPVIAADDAAVPRRTGV